MVTPLVSLDWIPKKIEDLEIFLIGYLEEFLNVYDHVELDVENAEEWELFYTLEWSDKVVVEVELFYVVESWIDVSDCVDISIVEVDKARLFFFLAHAFFFVFLEQFAKLERLRSVSASLPFRNF